MKDECSKLCGRCAIIDPQGQARRRALGVYNRRLLCTAAAVGLAISLASCASMQQTIGGWFGAATPTPAPTPAPAPRAKTAATGPRVYFAGNEGMTVYSDPSTSSKVLGELALHEKVTRTKTERGFAYVESAKSGLKGWVINAQFIWRLPGTAPAGGTPPPGQAPPEEPAAVPAEQPQEEPPVVEPTATPTNIPVPAAPKAKVTPAGAAPSIFNPY